MPFPISEWQLLAIHLGPRVELIRMSNCMKIVARRLVLIESDRLCLLYEWGYFAGYHILLILNLLQLNCLGDGRRLSSGTPWRMLCCSFYYRLA